MTALHETTLGLIKRLNIDDLLKAIVDRAGELVGAADGYMIPKPMRLYSKWEPVDSRIYRDFA